MPREGFERKLTAILSTMVIGYRRLDQGRVEDSTGDNLLAEFARVLDAVNVAI